jgi:hypothetical protein
MVTNSDWVSGEPKGLSSKQRAKMERAAGMVQAAALTLQRVVNAEIQDGVLPVGFEVRVASDEENPGAKRATIYCIGDSPGLLGGCLAIAQFFVSFGYECRQDGLTVVCQSPGR